ncbi:MAG: hypothetical protein V4695_11215 [Pseudomonadota bacterium]
MSALDAVMYAIAEAVGCAVVHITERFIGRTFNVYRKTARKIGENTFLAAAAFFLLCWLRWE